MSIISSKVIKKILILLLFTSCFSASASDFIAPNSSGEPVVIDVSGLDITSDINVSVGSFADQPRPYRDGSTNSLVVFLPPTPSSEQTIRVNAGNSTVTKTISFRPSPSGILKSSLLPELQKARGGT